ncbi:MAG: ABC transporter permease [Gemmatimonadota bacterium]
MDRWSIELSRPAVEALRSLPRDEQRAVAERMRQLELSGPPPGWGEAEDGAGAWETTAAGQRLSCLVYPENRRIVVVTLHPVDVSLPELAGRRVRRWIQAWMGGEGMGTLLQDLRFTLRSLRRSPGFAAVAVLTLGLGMGAATAIYSVADGVLFEPLPYGEPDEVVTVWASWNNFPDRTWLSVPEFQLLHQETRAFEDAALYQLGSATFTTVDRPERVGAASMTPNVFSVLGVQPVVGRTFTWDEARDEAEVAVIAYETWQRRWDGDPSVVGGTVEIDGGAVTVLGVMPPGFILPADFSSSSPSEVFRPGYVDLESPAPDLGGGGSHGSYGVARLLDGQTVADARADVERILAQNVQPVGLYDPEVAFAFRVFGAKEDIVGSVGATLWLLLGAVVLVLLIACGNVANLLLSRAEARVREMSLRTALGAGRGRIVRQLLTESVVLAIFGGVLGVAVASIGVPALLAIDPDAVPRSASASVDPSVLLFALAASLATAVVFGMMPALRVLRDTTSDVLRDRRGIGGGSSNRVQGLLIASQMAMAVVLLTGSILMIQTFVGLLRVDPGFEPQENVLTFRLTAPGGTYPETEQVVAFYQELRRQLGELPGVRQAGAARLLPLASTMGDAGVFVEGYQPAPNESNAAEWQYVTPGYFEVMGVPLLAGRGIDDRDIVGEQETIVVSESLARHYWGDRDPIGSRVGVLGDTTVVIGVVGDVAHNELTGNVRETFYRPHAQQTSRSLTFTVATEGDPYTALPAIRGVVRGIDPTMPIAEIRSMDEVMAGSRASHRFATVLLGAFAAIALTLAVVGIYGVISYAVSRRRSEIGVRMALGAESGTVVGMVLRQGMATALIGVAVGTGAALLMTGLLEGMLYGVEAHDPLAIVGAPALFALVALVACWIPAARASRVDPSEALRYE